jgi:hypothetical protein
MTLRVADELPQHGLFEDGGIAVGARLHEALALHPGGHGIGDVVGCSVEVSDGRQQGRGVPGRWRKPGTTVPTYALSSFVRSCSGSRFSWSRRIPAGWRRRHSVYIESADRDAAIRSGIALSPPQTRHQVRMSSSLGAFFADSIRLVLASCQPAAADRARAVRQASRRMPRSRSASCSRAR